MRLVMEKRPGLSALSTTISTWTGPMNRYPSARAYSRAVSHSSVLSASSMSAKAAWSRALKRTANTLGTMRRPFTSTLR